MFRWAKNVQLVALVCGWQQQAVGRFHYLNRRAIKMEIVFFFKVHMPETFSKLSEARLLEID